MRPGDRARAEGGRRRPAGAAPRADRSRARARAVGGRRRAAARRGAAEGRCGSHDTLRARSRSCRRRRARSACTSAARPSTRAPTSATRGPFVDRHVAAQLAPRARLRRDARPQHHRRQRQDLRGRAGRERRARRRTRRSGTSRTRTSSASAGPTTCRRRARRSPAIVALIEELVERGYAYEVEGDVYFRVARCPTTAGSRGQRPDQVEEQEPNPRKEDPRDFALWKANKPGEDTSWDSPWGRGRPGWHIECSVMAEELLGPGVRDPRRRARPRLPAPRERARAVARARPRVRADLDAQRDAALHRREDVEVDGERDRRSARRSTSGAARRCCSSS